MSNLQSELLESLNSAQASLNSLGITEINLPQAEPLKDLLKQYEEILPLCQSPSNSLQSDLISSFSSLKILTEDYNESQRKFANPNSSHQPFFSDSLKQLKILMMSLILMQKEVSYEKTKNRSSKLFNTYQNQNLEFMMVELKSNQFLKTFNDKTEINSIKSVLFLHFPCFFQEISDLTVNEMKKCLGIDEKMSRYKIREVVDYVFGTIKRLKLFQNRNSKYLIIEKALNKNKVKVEDLFQDFDRRFQGFQLRVFPIKFFIDIKEECFLVSPEGIRNSPRFVADRIVTIGKNDEYFKNDISLPVVSNDDVLGVQYFLYLMNSQIYFVDVSEKNHAKIRVSVESRKKLVNQQIIEFGANHYQVYVNIDKKKLKFKMIPENENNEAITGIEIYEIKEGIEFTVGSSPNCKFSISDQSSEPIEFEVKLSDQNFYLTSHSEKVSLFINPKSPNPHPTPSHLLNPNDLLFLSNFGLILTHK